MAGGLAAQITRRRRGRAGFEIQGRSIRHIFLLQNKANKLLKTQEGVPKSDKTKPISDTFPPL